MKIIIVCHAEFGYAINKRIIFGKGKYAKGIKEGIKNAIEIADKYGARISFALMPEVVNEVPDLEGHGHSIGLHIHPEDNKLKGIAERKALRDHSYERQKEMIARGKELIREKFPAPKVFVAGNWSENNDTIKALNELGFTHDCTPCPRFVSNSCDWSGLRRISLPYHPSEDDHQREGDMPITMIPVAKEITGGVVSPENPIGVGFLKAAFVEYYSQDLPVFHIAFHSPSMTSSYFKRIFDELLGFISKHKEVEYCLPNEIKAVRTNKNIRTKIFPYVKYFNKDALIYCLRSIR